MLLTDRGWLQFVVLFMAVMRARGVAALLNAAYTAEEFEFYLADSKSKLLLLPAEGNTAAETAAAKIALPVAKCRFSILSEGTGSIEFVSESPGFDLGLDKGEADIEAELSCDLHDDMALFLHTSGTTSRPKGVPLTQLNLATSTLYIKETYEFSTSDATVITLSAHRFWRRTP